MGLLSTEVEVELHGKMINYYDALGYNIPRTEKIVYDKNGHIKNRIKTVSKGTKIKVSINDLPPYSNLEVDVKCDKCGKQYRMIYENYTNKNYDGKIYCIACACKIFNSGEKNPNWKPCKSNEERELQRSYPEYHDFIKKVMARDNYICQCCGDGSKNKIEVHHLNGYDWYFEGRTDETNGITLCKDCHKNFHNNYGLGGNTKEQFEEWIGKRDIILQTYNGEIPKARWAYCINDNEIIKNIVDYCKKNNLLNYYIYCCCNGKCFTAYKKVYLWYDEYISMSQEDVKRVFEERMRASKSSNQSKKVVCINYRLIFNSIACGSSFLNVERNQISRCCNGRALSAGKSSNGEPLIWRFAKDIDNLDDYKLVPMTSEKISL